MATCSDCRPGDQITRTIAVQSEIIKRIELEAYIYIRLRELSKFWRETFVNVISFERDVASGIAFDYVFSHLVLCSARTIFYINLEQ